ncbi:hypothetical protein MVEN_01330400 [Mycena venus]|uniref:Uncharacterized protein n=1 Tax=Mycena venus TaxID=2733690 RepID=A0A8H6XXT9_9AGAR|nr:hypothetical protein MVEN_01330400 [Mycena venus]
MLPGGSPPQPSLANMNRTMNLYYCPGRLTKSINLVLTFTPPSKSAVAWQVIHMPSVPGSLATTRVSVSYTGRLAVGCSQDTTGGVVSGILTVPINPGETVDLNWQDGAAAWSIPTKSGDIGTLIKARNKTPNAHDISVGTLQTVSGVDMYSPCLQFKRVGSQMAVELDFHPILQAYVNTESVQNELIRAEVVSDLLTEWNLTMIPPVSNWLFSEKPEGGYQITQLSSQGVVNEMGLQAVEALNLVHGADDEDIVTENSAA